METSGFLDPQVGAHDPQPGNTGSQRLVSILVVNYNGAPLLPGCLNSLSKVSYQNREVIVVDNGSTDDSLQVLAAYSWVKVVRSDRNLGFAGGNNLGLGHCTGAYVLLLNNDTVVNSEFLTRLCEYLASHPEVGIVQGKMVLPRFGGRLDVCGSFLTALGLPYHYGYFKTDQPKYQRNFPVFSAKGACLLFRRELLEAAGGFLFDEDFFCYYEETDFCHRAWLGGYEVHFVASPPIQHFMGATAGGPHASAVLRHYLRNMAFSLLSNLSFSSRLRILPLFFAVFLASMAAAILTLKPGHFAAHWGALTWCLRHYEQIRARRRLIARIRRRTDPEIFAQVLRTPRLSYFVKTFSGRLAEYEDVP